LIDLYNPKSSKAEEFINHEEILSTLAYADEHKHDKALITEILAKAKLEKGLSHREASVLLACDIPELNEEIFAHTLNNAKILMDKLRAGECKYDFIEVMACPGGCLGGGGQPIGTTMEVK
jgi:iron only hydrogenase large subunit-like protein